MEMLDFLKNYNIVFNLSVDGGEKFANWRRPLKSDSGGVGYYKHTKKIFPSLLYYFPQTRYKVIVTKRCIDLVYSQYLEAESLGFRNIEFVIDLNERGEYGVTRESHPTGTTWSKEDFDLFSEQMVLIAKEISAGLALGIERAHVTGIDVVLRNLISNFSEEPVCRVLDERTNVALSREETFCLNNFGLSAEKAKELYYKELEENNYSCPKDPSCPFYKGCLSGSCLQDNYGQNGKLTEVSEENCGFYKAFGVAALNILNFGNEVKIGDFYAHWLQKFLREEDYNAC